MSHSVGLHLSDDELEGLLFCFENTDLEFKSIPYDVRGDSDSKKGGSKFLWDSNTQIGNLLRDIESMVNSRRWSGRVGYLILGVAEGKPADPDADFKKTTIVGLNKLWVPRELADDSAIPLEEQKARTKARDQYSLRRDPALTFWCDESRVQPWLDALVHEFFDPMPDVTYYTCDYNRKNVAVADPRSRRVGIITVAARQPYPVLFRKGLLQNAQSPFDTAKGKVTTPIEYKAGTWFERVGRSNKPIEGKDALERMKKALAQDVFEVSGAYLIAGACGVIMLYVSMQMFAGWCIRDLRDKCASRLEATSLSVASRQVYSADQMHLVGMFLLVLVANLLLFGLALFWEKKLPTQFKWISRTVWIGVLIALCCWFIALYLDGRAAQLLDLL